MTYFCVTWLSGDAKGYADWFPTADFVKPTMGAERVHLVTGPRGGRYHARCRVTVSQCTAVLDYRPFPEYNERYGMELGVMELRFADASRSHITHVAWDRSELSLREARVSSTSIFPRSTTSSRSDPTYGLRLQRPDQSRFRQSLDRAYGGRCCISGCPVPFALQAAHIAAYSDAGSDVPANGLLLRSDLHALFDALQLAIHPRTLKVHFSPEARSWPEYARLHARTRIHKPQPGFEKDGPSQEALAHRWRAFRTVTLGL